MNMDWGFVDQLNQLQGEALLTPKEADFRQYLVKTGAAEEIVKVLVGMEEAPEKPADASLWMQEHFGSQEMALVSGRPIDKINEVVGENEELKAKFADLEAQFAATMGKIADIVAEKRRPSLEALIRHHPMEPPDEDEPPPPALDLAKMYTQMLMRFPAGSSDGEGSEPAPWSPEAAEEPPVGSATAEALGAWSADAFGMDSEFARKSEPALLDSLLQCADPASATPAEGEEAPPSLEMELALKVHALFWTLVAAVAPVAEAVEAAPAE